MITNMNESILTLDESPTNTVIEGNSPLIIAGPHNGHLVPQSLHDENGNPLGIHASAFDPASPFKRHEACDWGVAELFTELQNLEKKSGKAHNYISGNYSRLVSDLSRAKEDTITEQSSENENEILGNINLTPAQKKARIKQFHEPFHQKLEYLISDTRDRFGYAIFLDLHSFTPTWQGKDREVHIGTLANSSNFVEKHFAKTMPGACASKNLKFAADYPYNLKTLPRERRKTSLEIEEYGVWYTGLEIRNDLLGEIDTTKTIAKLIFEITLELISHTDTKVFVKPPEETEYA